MYTLFVISVLCFCALVIAALAIARQVRTRRPSTHSEQDFAQHLFAAAEDQNSRGPRSLKQQHVKDVQAQKNWNRVLKPIHADVRNQSISSKRF
jgi:hypothetical protein